MLYKFVFVKGKTIAYERKKEDQSILIRLLNQLIKMNNYNTIHLRRKGRK